MSQHDTLTLEPTRAAFERYFLESRKSKGANRKPTFERFEDGTYKDDHTQRHWWTWQNAIATPAQAQQSEPAKPLFASKVSARKWAELQDDGARMQSIAFDGHKSGQPGTIDPWGVVLWDQAQQAGEPVAWRWRNCVGGWVTGWLDYKPSQRACIEQQVNEAGGIIQYAYATNPPAPAQPVQQMLEGWKLVDNKDGSITVSTPAGGVVTLWRKGQGSTEFIAYRLAQMLLTASPTPPAQQPEAVPSGLHEKDIYDFAGWLTSRPGVMEVGCTSWACPMADAVVEYIKTFPERFAPAQHPAGDVVRDAERYRFLAERCRSASEHWGGRWWIVIDGPAPKSHDSEDDFDAAIDAAIAASGRQE